MPAGGRDPGARPELGRRVAALIPGAQFDVLEEEATGRSGIAVSRSTAEHVLDLVAE